MLIFFGIILPVVALIVELAWGPSADIFVDPIPTWWHTLLVASVPLLNAACIYAIRSGAATRRSTLFIMNGIAMGVAGVYALVYLPISFVGAIGIALFGFGLLPLSPLTSFLASFVVCQKIVNLPPTHLPNSRSWRPRVLLATSIAAGLLGVICGEVPAWLTQQGIRMAVRGDQQERAYAVSFLRSIGLEQELAHQLRSGRQRSLLRHTRRVARRDANDLFFRVTGKQLSEIAIREPNVGIFWRGQIDTGLGGEDVANRVDGLSMQSSRIDTEVDAGASLAYTEWTMEFCNCDTVANEARAQILLPPDGVVSRLTLWVNGEPREAAFSSTGKVRSAYQEVAVRQRRDPVLVTWKGKDRVLMQCFPVPANGGTMKVRVGITAPLRWLPDSGTLELPRIVEQNFESDQIQHVVWINGDVPLQPAATQSESSPVACTSKDGVYVAQGSLSSEELSHLSVDIMHRPEERSLIRSQDSLFAATLVSDRNAEIPERIQFVIDGSRTMRQYFPDIASFVVGLHGQTKVELLLAADEVVDLSSLVSDSAKLATALRANASRGGCDNTPALGQAWGQADESTELVWIHGIQPVESAADIALEQLIEHDFASSLLWDMQLGRGPNRVMEGIQDQLDVRLIGNTGSPLTDLKRWWSQIDEPVANVVFEPAVDSDASDEQSSDVEDHPKAVDLWASARVNRLLREARRSRGKRYGLRNEATQFAAANHLVTPVSGAVVLETQAQYERAGLVPEDQKQIVGTPEPSGGMLMVLSLLPLWHSMRKRRRRPQQ